VIGEISMENIIIIAVLIIIIGLAGFYIYKAKKSGRKCIGCPYGDKCSSANSKGSCCCGKTDSKNDSE
jgi:hypothetical protein